MPEQGRIPDISIFVPEGQNWSSPAF
jgi:hypothetical protein